MHYSRMIRITGPRGFPIYAEKDFLAVEPEKDEYGCSVLHMDNFDVNPDLPKYKAEDIQHCEIRIGSMETLFISASPGSEVVSRNDEVIEIEVGWKMSVFVKIALGVNRTQLRDVDVEDEFFFEDLRNEHVDWVRFEFVAYANFLFTDEELLKKENGIETFSPSL